ncbi:hypothetical protein BJX65DRAFT_314185 [Aspergillus insuetus]
MLIYVALFLLSLLSLAAVTGASDPEPSPTTTSMYLWGIHSDKTILGSIMDNDETAITYYLTCPPEVPSFTCGFGPGITAVANIDDTYTWWGGRGGYGGQYGSAVCTYGSDTDLQRTVTIGDSEHGTMHYHAVTVTAGSITGEMETSSAAVEPTSNCAGQGAEEGEFTTGSEGAEETEESAPRPTGGAGRVMGRDGVVVGGAAAVIACMGAANKMVVDWTWSV